MDFNNVRLEAKAGIYRDGKIICRNFYLPDGEMKTLGYNSAGEYRFEVSAAELIEITQGEMAVKMPGEATFTNHGSGGVIKVPAGTVFDAIVRKYVDYICSYPNE